MTLEVRETHLFTIAPPIPPVFGIYVTLCTIRARTNRYPRPCHQLPIAVNGIRTQGKDLTGNLQKSEKCRLSLAVLVTNVEMLVTMQVGHAKSVPARATC